MVKLYFPSRLMRIKRFHIKNLLRFCASNSLLLYTTKQFLALYFKETLFPLHLKAHFVAPLKTFLFCTTKHSLLCTSFSPFIILYASHMTSDYLIDLQQIAFFTLHHKYLYSTTQTTTQDVITLLHQASFTLPHESIFALHLAAPPPPSSAWKGSPPPSPFCPLSGDLNRGGSSGG